MSESSRRLPPISSDPNNPFSEFGQEDVSRQLSILKHRKKQAANDAQLLL